jgi:predicted pyridoxine 5'-phosphate oxidase superfamily flavin-nucleotide-binding protein
VCAPLDSRLKSARLIRTIPPTLSGMVEKQITTVDELVALVGVPLPRVANKVRPTLHELDRQWLAASPFCLVATADDYGACDVSPKGDAPDTSRM